MTQRIQKIISQWGIASRRKAEKMILAGRVQLNGKTVKLGDKADVTVDVLKVDGKVIRFANRPPKIYLLLNKPPNTVSTCDDPQNRQTVLDLLPAKLSWETGIHPVGRLDFASSGALLLTNDGELTLGLTHPRYHLPKTYLVWLNERPTAKILASWREGIMLDGRKTLPAKVKMIEQQHRQTLLEVILTEGRNRQIRRTAAQFGFEVLKLHRIAIGNISLKDSDKSELASGSYRHLNFTEIEFLKNSFKSKLFNLATKA